jgi:hypothetical protein
MPTLTLDSLRRVGYDVWVGRGGKVQLHAVDLDEPAVHQRYRVEIEERQIVASAWS